MLAIISSDGIPKLVNKLKSHHLNTPLETV